MGMVCYYGKHYSTFFFQTKIRKWMYFDDAHVKEVRDAEGCVPRHGEGCAVLHLLHQRGAKTGLMLENCTTAREAGKCVGRIAHRHLGSVCVKV